MTNPTNPLTFLQDLAKDLLDPKLDPMKRQDIIRGYAKLLGLREQAMRQEVRMDQTLYLKSMAENYGFLDWGATIDQLKQFSKGDK